MPAADAEAFIKQTIEKEITWKRIRILGGEPTLHSRIFGIIDLLMDYQRAYNPAVRLVLGTNFSGADVHRVLEKLPAAILVSSGRHEEPGNRKPGVWRTAFLKEKRSEPEPQGQPAI